MNGKLLVATVLATLMAVALGCQETHDCRTCFQQAGCKLVWQPNKPASCLTEQEITAKNTNKDFVIPASEQDCATKRATTWHDIRLLAEKLGNKPCPNFAAFLYKLTGGNNEPLATIPGFAAPPNPNGGNGAPAAQQDSVVFEVKLSEKFSIVIIKEKVGQGHIYHVYFETTASETLKAWMSKAHVHNNHVLFLNTQSHHHPPNTDPTHICTFLTKAMTEANLKTFLATTFGIDEAKVPETGAILMQSRQHQALNPADLLQKVNDAQGLDKAINDFCPRDVAQGLEDDEAVEENDGGDDQVSIDEQAVPQAMPQAMAQNMGADDDNNEDESDPAVLIHLKSLIRHRHRRV